MKKLGKQYTSAPGSGAAAYGTKVFEAPSSLAWWRFSTWFLTLEDDGKSMPSTRQQL